MSFFSLLENIYDAKRGATYKPIPPEPGDDDYDPRTDYDDEENWYTPPDYQFGGGLNAEYPKAKLGQQPGIGRGISIKTPKEMEFPKDRMSGSEEYQTLLAKAHAHEPLTPKEVKRLTRLYAKKYGIFQ